MAEEPERRRARVERDATRAAEAGADVPVRPAVSVILLRMATELEVFVQHRVETMDFAAGVLVFPGGRVDPADRPETSGLSGEDARAHARAWSRTERGAEPAAAATLVACARRELEEETGALLAAEALTPWANWITPPGRSRRFDTYFYIAEPTPHSAPSHRTTEASGSEWRPVTDLLAAEEEGRLKLMRPTRSLLAELAEFGSLAAILAANRDIFPVRPHLPGSTP